MYLPPVDLAICHPRSGYRSHHGMDLTGNYHRLILTFRVNYHRLYTLPALHARDSAGVPAAAAFLILFINSFSWSCTESVEVRRRFAAALIPRLLGNSIPGHTTRAPPMQTQPAVKVGFELATDGIQLHIFAKVTVRS